MSEHSTGAAIPDDVYFGEALLSFIPVEDRSGAADCILVMPGWPGSFTMTTEELREAINELRALLRDAENQRLVEKGQEA
jgi:hypothetical protein